MNDTHSAELCPLAYAAGLAIGLIMILALPAAPKRPVRETLEVSAAGDWPTAVRRSQTAAIRP